MLFDFNPLPTCMGVVALQVYHGLSYSRSGKGSLIFCTSGNKNGRIAMRSARSMRKLVSSSSAGCRQTSISSISRLDRAVMQDFLQEV